MTKKFFTLTAAIVCLMLNVNAQAPDFEWVKSISGAGGQQGEFFSPGKNGNFYLLGYGGSLATIDTIPVNFTSIGSYLVKYNSDGRALWARHLSGISAEGVREDAQGNVYVTGYYVSTMTLGGYTLNSHGDNDFFVLKYDSTGNVVWLIGYGGLYEDRPVGITTDNSGNILILGNFKSPSFNIGAVTLTHTGMTLGRPNVFVAKFNPSGSPLWAKQAVNASGNSFAESRPFGIASDSSGNVYVTGWYQVGVSFGSHTITYPANTNPNIFIVKYNSSGNEIWLKHAGDIYHDESHDIAADAAGNIYITGNTNSPACAFDSYTIPNPQTLLHTFVAKYDSSGNALWATGIQNLERGLSIAIDAQGNSWICGDFEDSVITINGITMIHYQDDSISGSLAKDAIWVKVDSSGTPVWAASAGGDFNDEVDDVMVNTDGAVYFTGYYTSTSFEIEDTILHNPGFQGQQILYVAKYSDGSPCTNTSSTINASICQGESYLFNGINRTTSGAYLDTLVNGGGCDSVLTLNLTVNNNPTASISPATVTMCNGDNATLTASGGTSYAWSNSLGSGASKTVSPTSTTTYTVTVSDANTCSATTSRTVTVNQPNSATLNITQCFGTSYPFNGQNLTTAGTYYDTLTNASSCDSLVTLNLLFNSFAASSFSESICDGESYSFNNQNLTTSGTYKDTLTASGGCDSIVTLNLTVNDLPQPTITQSNDTLSTGSFTSYQWLRNGTAINNATSQQLHVIQNGDYTVIVTDANGCSDTSAVKNVTGVGITEMANDFEVKLYPNPNTGTFTMEFSDEAEREVVITDLLGRTIVSNTPVNRRKEFSLNENAPGIYFVRIIQKEQMKVLKVSVMK